MQRLNPVVVLALCCAPAIASADAEDNPTLASDWMFSLGAALTDSDPKIGLSRDGSDVDLIDLERLGADTEDIDYYFSASWQGLERWRFDFTSYLTKLDGGRFTDQDYVYGDLELPEGSGVAVDFTSRFYILNAHFAIWQAPNWEVGAGLGIYALDWDGAIALVDGDTGEQLGVESEDFLAPLPTLGLFARYAFTEHLAVRAGVDWLSANIDEYDGEVFAVNAGLDWWFTEHWGLSGGINFVDVDVEIDNRSLTGYLDANWDSAYLKVNVAF